MLSSTKKKYTDEEAIEELVRELYPKIHSYVYRRVYHEALAKDITQETFYQFFRNKNQYQEQGKLLNYLYRIAYHLISDHFRKETSHLPLVDMDLEDKTVVIDQQVAKKEQIVILRERILTLPMHLQEVLLLRFEEGLKYKDISKIMEVNISTVKSRVQLAITLLQNKESEESIR